MFSFIYRKTLCSTLLNNDLDFLTITSPYKNNDKKHGIILMARVHPGETVSSWIMKGAIDFITSDHEDAVFIRNNYIIKIIPMINPDGVICGNFRTSVAGSDLNRRWKNPFQTVYPEIFNSKEMVLKMASERNIDLVVDLHGHSGEYNIFLYGNSIRGNPRETKIYPFILSRTSEIFFYSMCKFKMQKFKRGTARISLFHEIGNIPNIVCIEASVAGVNAGKYKNMHWSNSLLQTMGRDVFKGFAEYLRNIKHKFVLLKHSKEEEESKKQVENEIEEIEEKILKENEQICKSNSDSESGGSDSDPSIDNLEDDHLAKFVPIKKFMKSKSKKKTLKTVKLNKKPQIEEIKIEKILEKPKEKVKIPTIIKIQEKVKEVPKIINVNINITRVEEKIKKDDKVDSETQTEDIFFRFPWTFFKNKYKIITPSYKKLESNRYQPVDSFNNLIQKSETNNLLKSQKKSLFTNNNISKMLNLTNNIGNNLIIGGNPLRSTSHINYTKNLNFNSLSQNNLNPLK